MKKIFFCISITSCKKTKKPKSKTAPGTHLYGRSSEDTTKTDTGLIGGSAKSVQRDKKQLTECIHLSSLDPLSIFLSIPSVTKFRTWIPDWLMSLFFLCTFCLYISSALFLSFFNLNKLHFYIFIYIFFFPAMANLL